jgi:hypothetical protein
VVEEQPGLGGVGGLGCGCARAEWWRNGLVEGARGLCGCPGRFPFERKRWSGGVVAFGWKSGFRKGLRVEGFVPAESKSLWVCRAGLVVEGKAASSTLEKKPPSPLPARLRL